MRAGAFLIQSLSSSDCEDNQRAARFVAVSGAFMLRTLFLTLATLMLAAAPGAAGQTRRPDVDTIIARHVEARGGEAALRAINSLVFDRGVYSEPGFSSPGDAVMMLMRPYYKLVGHPERNPQYMEGYDGAAWEWFADPGIVLRTTGDASEAIRHYADVDGPLIDYAAKGSRAELIGEETIGDRRAYQVRLTMMDGYETDFFIDGRTYMIIASRHTASIHAFGDRVASETRFSDFRRVAGVMFHFRSSEVEIATGRELNAMQWGSIEANQNLPAAWFSPPAFERTQVQTFMEQLFVQRADASAVMWTYHNFRRTHPDVDTREAAEIMGFQILKMGQRDQAIALLERNAADYPNAASSAFGLGRAYARSGRPDDARREFNRALQLEPGHARATQALAELNTN
jgi:tetratricopeptide (TPR) repeat protein